MGAWSMSWNRVFRCTGNLLRYAQVTPNGLQITYAKSSSFAFLVYRRNFDECPLFSAQPAVGLSI